MAPTADLHTKLAIKIFCFLQTLFLALFLFGSRVQSAADTLYIYDELGRLVAVINAAGDAAIYAYDHVGNLLSISHKSASEVSIIEFTPNSGPIGSSVTIYGTGFSLTPGQNAVSFNGISAAITSVAPNQIIATVHEQATTGPITVTTPLGVASSNTPFVVTASGVPTISTFSPNIGTIGTTVEIGGSNFETEPQNNKTKFNLTYASNTTATTTNISTIVPAKSGSGRIRISTPAGTAESSADFFIPPAPYTPADVLVTGRMGFGETKPVTISTANKIGLFVFDGTAGQRVSLGLSGITIPGSGNLGTVAIYKPDGTVLLAPFNFTGVGDGSPSQVLPVNGTYALVVDLHSTNTGKVDITLNADITTPITVNGGPLTLLMNRVGQNALLPFTGFAGQRVSVGMSNVTIQGPDNVGEVTILKGDLTPITLPFKFGMVGHGTPSYTLPENNIYFILVNPLLGSFGNVTITLSEDLSPPIAINGSPLTLALTPVGQNAFLPFSGTAGQRISVGMSGVTITGDPSGGRGLVSIYAPDGSTLLSPFQFGIVGDGTPSKVLPVSGTYAIFVDPYWANTGSVTITLSEDLSPPISINGAAPTLNLNRAGQNGWLTFSGTAGQRISVGMSDVTITGDPSGGRGLVSIYAPDGSTLLTPFQFGTVGDGTPSKVLPVGGTYSIYIDPYWANTGNVTITLSEDLSPPTSINGAAPTLNLSRPGQNGWLTFSGTAGQRISVGMSGVTITGDPSGGRGLVSILKPDGSALLNPFQFGIAGDGTPSKVLPVSGTYAIYIDPYRAYTGQVTITLSEDLSPPISINGSSPTLNLNPGQNGWLSFAGTAGQRVSVGISSVTYGGPAGAAGLVSIYKPDGSTLLNPFEFGTVGHGTPSKVLPVTGTYSIYVDPYLAYTANLTVTLSEDLSPPISINGPAVALNMSRQGQNGWLTFSGTTGQRVSVGISSVTYSGPAGGAGLVSIIKPDGSALLNPFEFGTVGQGTPSKVLPVSGTFAIFVDPYWAYTANVTVTLSEDRNPGISINGSSPTLNLNPGQNAWVSFDGSAGQRVSVGLSGVTIPGQGALGLVSLFKPDGSVLLSPHEFYTSGQSTPTRVLPVNGTYVIAVDPFWAYTGNVTVTLSEDVAASITINDPATNVSLSRIGQNAKLTFEGTSGQVVTVRFTGNTIGNITVFLLRPDGSTVTGTSTSASAFNLPQVTLNATGTFSITIDPALVATGTINVAVTNP